LLPKLTATRRRATPPASTSPIRVLGAPLALSYVALREVSYGRGDTHAPMRATVAANLANIALAYLFIFVWEGGVAGAALATVLANGVELGGLLFSSGGWGCGR
jgi:Na+-driven multidrug efflux pump